MAIVKKSKERKRIEKQIQIVHNDAGGPFSKGMHDFSVLIMLVMDYLDARTK